MPRCGNWHSKIPSRKVAATAQTLHMEVIIGVVRVAVVATRSQKIGAIGVVGATIASANAIGPFVGLTIGVHSVEDGPTVLTFVAKG